MPDTNATTDSLITKPRAKAEDPAETAARLGMFGQMTRLFSNFYPTRLVCKRFGVPMPEHASQPMETAAPTFAPGPAAKVGKSRFQSAGFQADEKTDPTPKSEGVDEVSELAEERKSVQAELSIDPERNEALEQQKPGQALFKAIFGSDSEDESD